MIEVILNAIALYAIIGLTFLIIAMIFGGYRVSLEVVRVNKETGRKESVRPLLRDWVFAVSMSMVGFVVMWPVIIGQLASGGRDD